MTNLGAYRLLVTDVDGTLVDQNQEIPERNLLAIDRFRQSGGYVTLSTGRIEESARPYLTRIGANAPAILYNGGRVVEMRTGQVVWEATLPPNVAATVLKLFESGFSPGLEPIVYLGGRPRVRAINSVVAAYAHKDRITCEAVGGLRSLPDGPVSKILIIGDGSLLEDLELAIHDALAPGQVHTVRSEPDYLEVLPFGVSKGAALRRVAEWVGVPLAEAVAVGDNLNDLEMIQAVGLGVAVANAHPDLKAAADFVSPFTNDQAAVADVIERFCQ